MQIEGLQLTAFTEFSFKFINNLNRSVQGAVRLLITVHSGLVEASFVSSQREHQSIPSASILLTKPRKYLYNL